MIENKQANEKPLITYVKRADKTMHKIQIPKKIIELFGKEFIMNVYKDKIVLIPTCVPNDEMKVCLKYGVDI